jgi:light-regulated signal transduction histidine kinase (bacteriophytochrome)
MLRRKTFVDYALVSATEMYLALRLFRTTMAGATFAEEGLRTAFLSGQKGKGSWCASDNGSGAGIAPQSGRTIFDTFNRVHPRGDVFGPSTGLARLTGIVGYC